MAATGYDEMPKALNGPSAPDASECFRSAISSNTIAVIQNLVNLKSD